jgi:membrane protein YdbS with pleckstrin-like domain
MAPGHALAGHRTLRRYLLDGEHVVTAVHQHWGKVAEPVLTAVLALAVVLWLDTVMPATLGLLDSILWWGWLAVVARTAWRVLEWRHDWFVATDKRLILTYGLVTSKVAMMPLSKVTDMTYNRSPLGRLLGYGTFVMESAGQDQALHRVNFVPYPDHTYRSICAEIFGVDDHDRVPPDDDGAPDAEAGWPAYGEWRSTQEAHDAAGSDPSGHSAAIPIRGPGGARSVYRSPDLRDGDEDDGADRGRRTAGDDDTGPIPPGPPWRPDGTL